MKCPDCGREISNDSHFCEYCGKKVNKNETDDHQGHPNRALVWVGAVFSFLFPIIGLVLYGINRKEHPADAKKYLRYATVGFVLAVLAVVIEVVIVNNCYNERYGLESVEESVGESVDPYAEVLVYSQPEEFYCDGVYDEDHGLEVRVPDLNMSHFLVSFSFYPVSNNGKLSWTDAQFPLILGRRSRALGICLKSDKRIYVTTYNHDNIVDTGIPYVVGEYNDIVLEYQDGEVIVNGEKLQVGDLDVPSDDNVLTSKCYSTGNAFKGYIKDLSVINLY